MTTNLRDLMNLASYIILGLSFLFLFVFFIRSKRGISKINNRFLITAYILLVIFIFSKLFFYSPCISQEDLPANFFQ